MTIQSSSCITNSLPEADRIVDELRAADFSSDEISVLLPEGRPGTSPAPADRTENPESDGLGCGLRDILVSVHLKDGCGLSRAEEIFARVGPASRWSDDERPQSWL